MLGDEMIDEASRKMALVVSGKGRAAGMQRTSKFDAARGLTAAREPCAGTAGIARPRQVDGVRGTCSGRRRQLPNLDGHAAG